MLHSAPAALASRGAWSARTVATRVTQRWQLQLKATWPSAHHLPCSPQRHWQPCRLPAGKPTAATLSRYSSTTACSPAAAGHPAGDAERKVFRFKRFQMFNDRSAHKVGTDSILLGAWVARNHLRAPPARVLDVGAGSGILALMMAQSFADGAAAAVTVDAVEVDGSCAAAAAENFRASPWAASLALHHCRFQELVPALHPHGSKFDLVISNPPYFPTTRSSPPATAARARVRQDQLLPFQELVANAARVLSPAGCMCVVLPAPEAGAFAALAEAQDLHLRRRALVRTTPRKPPRRHLLEFVPHAAAAVEEETVTIHNSNSGYTAEYVALTRDFYLAF